MKVDQLKLHNIIEKALEKTEVTFECHYVGDEEENEIYFKFFNVKESENEMVFNMMKRNMKNFAIIPY